MFTPPEVTLPEWAKSITLVSGAGSSDDATCCVMSLARLIDLHETHPETPVDYWLSREREDDFSGVDPLIRAWAISCNDAPWWDSNEQRTAALAPVAALVIGTNNPALTRRRLAMFADRYFRRILRIGLRAFEDAALSQCSDELAALPEIVDQATASAAAPILDLALDRALALALDSRALARALALALDLALDLALARDESLTLLVDLCTVRAA